MASSAKIPSVGVEEEYQLVDPGSGKLVPDCKEVMKNLGRDLDADIQHELHLNQIEMASPVCQTMEEVRSSVRSVRGMLIEAAKKIDVALSSAGTNPLPVPDHPEVTPKSRYRAMTQRYQQIAREMLIFGCHVHVEMPNRELGVAVMNRCRRWLPMLQALTASSPFWDGHHTGYASYRHELWVQWPMAGPPPAFDDLADYEACIADLVKAGAIKDESFVYWDIRLPTKVPTIEFRGADVMSLVEETVGYTALVRALVMAATKEAEAHEPLGLIRPSVISCAMWHAARYGVDNDTIDPQTCARRSMGNAADELLEYLRPTLKCTGDADLVDHFVNDTIQKGNGAIRQRGVADHSDDLSAVVHHVVEETAADVQIK